jgi:uncharacterized membrane protein
MSTTVSTHYPDKFADVCSTKPHLGSEVKRPVDRIPSIDVLRGFAMILMALDHTCDFFTTGFVLKDLSRVPTSLYLTRCVTHLCAPTFVFLAELAAYLQLSRGKTKFEQSMFLITRGLAISSSFIFWRLSSLR